MKTNIAILRGANWDQLERDVVDRIRLLSATAKKGGDGEVWDKIANDLIVPNIKLLAQFCSNVEIKEEEIPSSDPVVLGDFKCVKDGCPYDMKDIPATTIKVIDGNAFCPGCGEIGEFTLHSDK